MSVPKHCVIIIGCNFESRVSQAGLHKQKKDTVSAKEGKVSLLRRGGQEPLKKVLKNICPEYVRMWYFLCKRKILTYVILDYPVPVETDLLR